MQRFLKALATTAFVIAICIFALENLYGIGPRVWKNNAGKKLNAVFVGIKVVERNGFETNLVVLKRTSDQKLFEIPIDTLSKFDQNIAKRLAERGGKEKSAEKNFLPPDDFWKPDIQKVNKIVLSAQANAQNGGYRNAIRLIEKAMLFAGLESDPAERGSDYIYDRADYYAAIGNQRPTQAIKEYNKAWTAGNRREYLLSEKAYLKAMELDPQWLWPENNLAWLLATCPDASIRDGRKAVRFARKCCRLSDWHNSSFIGTLAAAYAEAGDFQKAIQCVERCLLMENRGSHDSRLTQKMLNHFNANQAYRDN